VTQVTAKMSSTGAAPAMLFLLCAFGMVVPLAGYSYGGYSSYNYEEPPSSPPPLPSAPGTCVGDFTTDSLEVHLCSGIRGDLKVHGRDACRRGECRSVRLPLSDGCTSL
jgi:hypothetical protein